MRPSLKEIQKVALDIVGIPHEDWELLRCCRLQQVILAKKIISLVGSEYGYRHQEIASFLSMDRTTIIHNIKTLKEFYALYQDAKEMVDKARMALDKFAGFERIRVTDGWLARSANGMLIISTKEPEKIGKYWVAEGGKAFYKDAFPQITYASSPVKVKIQITIEDEKV